MDSARTPEPEIIDTEAAIVEEIADIQRFGRDISRRAGISWTGLLAPQDPILYYKGGTGIDFLEIYEKVAEDDQVRSCMQQRITAITSREWAVSPGAMRGRSPDAADIRAAEFVQDCIDHIPIDEIFNQVYWGDFYGYSVSEVLWARDGQEIRFDDIRVRNRKRFRFDVEMNPRLVTLTNPNGEILPDRKFWTYRFNFDNSDDPYGRGLAYWLYWLTYFKRNDLELWLRFLEKEATGKKVGKYEPGTSAEDQKKLLDALDALTYDSSVIIPATAMVELLQSMRSAGTDFKDMHSICNEAIAKVTLSQTMTTEDGSSRSQAVIHAGVKADVVQSTNRRGNESFYDQPLTWLVEFNRPWLGDVMTPVFDRKLFDEPNLESQADVVHRLYGIGFRPTLDSVNAKFGEGYVDLQAVEDQEPEEVPLSQRLGIGRVSGLLDFIRESQQLPRESVIATLEFVFGIARDQAVRMAGEGMPVEQPTAPTLPQPIAPAPEFAQASPDPIEAVSDRALNSALPTVRDWLSVIRQGMTESGGDLYRFRQWLDTQAFSQMESDELMSVLTDAYTSARFGGIYDAQSERSPEDE